MGMLWAHQGRFLALLACLSCWTAIQAWSDGRVFQQLTVPVGVNLPDQRALLWWSNGVERLVIETRFAGQGTNFAWVVPLPSVPQIEPATIGLFPTLESILRPEVIDLPPTIAGIAAFGAALVCLIIPARPKDRLWGADGFATGLAAVGMAQVFGWTPIGILGGLLWAALALVIVDRVRMGLERISILVLGLPVMALMFLMLFPSLGGAGAGAASPVEVVERKHIGSFDVEILRSHEAGALPIWLHDHGFAVSSNALPTIERYARDNWVFVTAKLSRTNASFTTNAIHPLAFTFAVPSPVYPLQLTGTGTDALDLELFVFASDRARCPPLKVWSCRRIDEGDSLLPVRHPGLCNFTAGATRLTHLRGRLEGSALSSDLTLEWEPFRERIPRLYSRRGAALTAVDWVGIGLACVFLGWTGYARWHRPEIVTTNRASLTALGAGAVLTCIVYGVLPKATGRLERRFPTASIHFYGDMMQLRFEVENSWSVPPTIDSIRRAIALRFPELIANHSTGSRQVAPREEDSPGNYGLRAVEGGVELLSYDRWGEPRPYVTFRSVGAAAKQPKGP